MSESRSDGDRVLLATTIILAVISVVMYFIVYLTLFQYQLLNDTGRTFALVALVLSALAMLLACYLALTQRSRSLASPGLSGLGWVLICGGLMIGAPALGIEGAFPEVSTGGVPAASFLIIAGAAMLQAERNHQQAAQDDRKRLN
jgi:NADH:ubiquinone oxidoreductase subunit 4 (subunit M)